MKTLAVLFALSISGVAQTIDAPEPRFLNKGNVIAFSFVAGAMALDGYTTQRNFSNHSWITEKNPIARPFVTKGALGQTTISSIGFAATIGTSYWMHKTHHHRLERLIPILVGAASLGFGAANLRY